ncbi:MAG: transcriptional repressor [Thermodesulfobacteriota bacterium]|nr:transcriptional repressor [Thermodesulfobacteriota bacterium]
MADPKIRLNQMLAKLRKQDYRITPQRLAVLKILASSKGHPGVEQIYEQVVKDFPTTSLATVYKTLTLMKEIGEVWEIGFPEGSNRYDGNKPYPHPHLICVKCKKIIDPDLATLSDMTQELEQDTDFRILNHRLDFFGICPGCRKRK